ncbi:MAG TPA: hypothetical protein VFZ68_08535 [Acidimicrobiales bacterium]
MRRPDHAPGLLVPLPAATVTVRDPAALVTAIEAVQLRLLGAHP